MSGHGQWEGRPETLPAAPGRESRKGCRAGQGRGGFPRHYGWVGSRLGQPGQGFQRTHLAPSPGRTSTRQRTYMKPEGCCHVAPSTRPTHSPPWARSPYRLSKAELSWPPSGPLGTIPTQIWCLSMTCGFSKQTGKGLEAAVEGRDVPHEVLNPQHPGNQPPTPAPGRVSLTSASPGRRRTPAPTCRW